MNNKELKESNRNHFGKLARELERIVDEHIHQVAEDSISYKEIRNKLIDDPTIVTLSPMFNFIDSVIKERALNRGFYEKRGKPLKSDEDMELTSLVDLYVRNSPGLPIITLNNDGLFINDFRVPYVTLGSVFVKTESSKFYKIQLEIMAKKVIADNLEVQKSKNQPLL